MNIGTDFDFCVMVLFYLGIFVAGCIAVYGIFYGIRWLLLTLGNCLTASSRQEARNNYYTELMHEDWKQHPEHAQGRKLPEEKK